MQINDILNLPELDKTRLGMSHAKDTSDSDKSIRASEFLRAINMKDPTYLNPTDSQEDNLIEEIEESAAKMGADSTRASVAFAMSDSNFDKMTEDGFSPSDLTEDAFVTVAEKIKVALAKGGMDVSIMGGLDESAIEAMGQDPAVIERALEANDISTNQEMVADVQLGFRKLEELGLNTESGKLSTETIKYLLANNMEPTLNNIYQASVSSNDLSTREKITDINRDDPGLLNQVDNIIRQAGLVADFSSENQAFWMVENGISLNSDSLRLYDDLSRFNLYNYTNLDALSAMVDSVAQGNMPQDAYLLEGYSAMDQARDAKMVVDNARDIDVEELIANNKPLTVRDLADAQMTRLLRQTEISPQEPVEVVDVEVTNAAKKLLLETQLMMSTQANFSLIMKGYSIDTMPLNDLVNALSAQETDFYQQILGGEDIDSQVLIERIQTYDETLEIAAETKELPASQLALIDNIHTASLRVVHTEGVKSRANANMVNAIGSYETMSTEIRRDLGDSITKAFRNIDSILEDLEMDASSENRRAVRILGYNRMEINQEAIEKIKDTDSTVNRAFNALKPGVVAELIKQGKNPLDMTMDELISEAEEILSSLEGASQEGRYAKFLYKLDQDNSITPEERNSFIGVYRLITQVEATDGAAIGQLLQQGVDVTMRNLMMAVRTAKKEGREYEVSDELGAYDDFDTSSLSITQQIEMSFQTNALKTVEKEITPQKLASFESEDTYMSMSPDGLASALTLMNEDPEITATNAALERAYSAERHEDINRALKAEDEVYAFLEQNDVPVTANTLSAVTALISNGNNMYRTLLNKEAQRKVGLDVEVDPDNLDAEIDNIIADLIKDFGESVKTPEDMAEAQQRLEEMAENVMKNMLVEEDVTEIDVRGMKLIQTQISTLGSVAQRNENYTIPIMVADEMGNLNLQIVRGREDKGMVDIAFSMENTGTVKASFRYEDGSVKGQLQAQREATRSMLADRIEDIMSRINQEASAPVEMTFSYNNRLGPEDVYSLAQPDFELADNRDDEIATKTLYGIARGFIDVLSNL